MTRMSGHTLTFKAGAGAMRMIRESGFSPEMIGTFAGASGGAKWLILSQLDRVVATEILPRLRAPVFTVGTSIGAWRFACYAQRNPLAAIERFEEAYLSQSYSERPDRSEITNKSLDILDTVFGDTGVDEVLDHPTLRTNVIAVRARHATGMEPSPVLGASLLAAAVLNAVSRRSLGWFFERVLFSDPRDEPPFADMRGFPLHRATLSADNLKPSILATGSIPLVLAGVRDIPGAPRGMYRDGGVIDYHLDIPQAAPGRLSLYLHFIDRVIPGWFDKALKHRLPDPRHLDNTLLISPSPAFVASLPHAKIPDRSDFRHFEPAEREANWRLTVDRCREMADELLDVLEHDRMADRLEPLL